MTPADDPARRLAGEVARAARRPGALRTLLLDLDGTLAPIAPAPDEARVPPPLLAALRRLLGRGWSVAVVSGRAASQVRSLVPVRGVRIFGSHGAEGSWDGGARPRPPRAALEKLATLETRARRLARAVPGAYVERKPLGIALHDRKVARGDLATWRQRACALLAAADLDGLEVLRGRRVIEVRPWGHHKGRVVEELLAAARPRGRDRSLLALGDDRTDEDMFRALRGRGLTVRVGRRDVTSLAERRLPSPSAVRRFLEDLATRE